jgi:hypothetical protein
VQRRIDKLERAGQADRNSRIAPSVYLIKSDGYMRTYEIALGGQPVNRSATPGRGAVAIIVDGAPGEEIK